MARPVYVYMEVLSPRDNISQLSDYDAPFCEQQYTNGSCYISLFKFKSFDQLIPPKLPQILDLLSCGTLVFTELF